MVPNPFHPPGAGMLPPQMQDDHNMPPNKRMRTEEYLESEEMWLAKFPGSVNIQVATPQTQEFNLEGKVFSLSLDMSSVVTALKSLIQEETTVPASKAKLVYEGHFMKDNLTLAYYNVRHNGVIQLQLKEREMAALQLNWSVVNAARARVNVINALEEEPEAEHVVEPGVIEQEARQVVLPEIIHEDVVDVDRILIFGRSSFSQWIHLVANIYVDGTFSISPAHFYQVFVIMGERQKFVMPLMYVLLPSKSEAIYAKMFGMIKRMWPTFNPTAADLDYELALMNALKSNFPGIKLGGCLFHLVKNLKKHLGTNSSCFTFSSN
uniref:Ubiquitin-like domain-containing protein n=1 Tax=Ditylenchus dipsaci TaxID=166011 RepID=A0A915DMY9_9BILA